jgi:Na+/proline symporter
MTSLVSHIDGGFGHAMEVARAAGKLRILDASFDPTRIYTLWSGLIGGMILTLAVQGTDQFFVQRLLAARSKADASWGLFASGVVVFAQFALFLVIGTLLWVYYQQTPLPVPLDRADKIVSIYVVYGLGSGKAGLIIAAIVAAALSPSTNALAATTVNDFWRPYVQPDATDAQLMTVSRAATVVWGLVQIAVALGAQTMRQGVLDAGLSALALATGAVLGAFLLGNYRPSVGGGATFVGMVAGIVAVVGLWWASPIAWTWHAFIGATTTIVVALAAAPFLAPRQAPA